MIDEKRSASHMISVIKVCYGFSINKIAERTGLSVATLYKWRKGYEPKPNWKRRLYEMYVNAPLKETVEELRLYDDDSLCWSLLALKRKTEATHKKLGEILNSNPSAISTWISGKTSPTAKSLPLIAKACKDSKLTKEDIEKEKTFEKRFVMTGKHTKSNKQIIFMKDRNGDVRDILRRVKKDTGILLKNIPAETGIKKRVWWHYTRPSGLIPNVDKQQRLFVFFQKLYKDKGLDFPLYIRKNNIP